ncbi:MAG: ATP-binding cassette domain-containing protein [Gammaproteobacteria bacterium]|nr:MAG: ATP-binding cassette domain-containing protein [Gammaproteobacteria bacterium]
MLKISEISLYRGGRQLFDHASLTVFSDQRIGIVGANGTGKSSLFALIKGELGLDSGSIDLSGDLVISSVAQETPAVERTALDYVIDGDNELRRLQAELAHEEAQGDGDQIATLHSQIDAIDGYTCRNRAAELLDGLGFSAQDMEKMVAEFSGGWRMRLNLAQALFCRSTLLLLDEPTNHLDLEAVVWLEGWLRSYQGMVLLISHDRDFLDSVVNGIACLEQQKLTLYSGNYTEFELVRAEKLAQQQALFEKQQREIEHMQSYITRFKAKATKARQAQSRVKALARMEKILPAHIDSGFSFHFRPAPKSPKPMLKFENAGFSYDPAIPIVDGLDLSIMPGDRIGLLGVNGAGKSTLIKIFACDLQLSIGDMLCSDGVEIGYFAQHQLEQLDLSASALLHMRRIDPKATDQELLNYLGGFGFAGDKVEVAVAPFSGGEKARLVLAMIVWQRPNLLLLDEPTNHLDLEMRQALVVALQEYDGAVVIVSHDRYLLNTTTDRFFLVDSGKLQEFDGDLEDYYKWLVDRHKYLQVTKDGDECFDETVSSLSRKDMRRIEAEKRKQLYPLKKQADSLESKIDKITKRLGDIEEEMADPQIYAEDNKGKLQKIIVEQSRLKSEVVELEEQWMEALELIGEMEGAL